MHEIVRAGTDVVMTMLDRLGLSSRAGRYHPIGRIIRPADTGHKLRLRSLHPRPQMALAEKQFCIRRHVGRYRG